MNKLNQFQTGSCNPMTQTRQVYFQYVKFRDNSIKLQNMEKTQTPFASAYLRFLQLA